MDIDEFELGLARNVFEECFESGVGDSDEVVEVDVQRLPRIVLSVIAYLFSLVYKFFIKSQAGRLFSESFCETCDSLNQ